jgi:hypothetical protein
MQRCPHYFGETALLKRHQTARACRGRYIDALFSQGRFNGFRLQLAGGKRNDAALFQTFVGDRHPVDFGQQPA